MTSSVAVTVDGAAGGMVISSVTIIVVVNKETIVEKDVYVVAGAQVDGVTAIVHEGGQEKGEVVLLNEVVVEVLVEVVVAPCQSRCKHY